jgi:hypothetical protein
MTMRDDEYRERMPCEGVSMQRTAKCCQRYSFYEVLCVN